MSKKDKTATLLSSDGVMFKLDEACSVESDIFSLKVKHEVHDTMDFCSQFSSNILSKVLHFLRTRAAIRNSNSNSNAHDDNLFKDFHSEFMKQNHCLVLDLLSAAYFLQIKSLFDLMSEAIVVDITTGKCSEEISKIFLDEFTLTEMEYVIEYESLGLV